MIAIRPMTQENALRYAVYFAARLLPHPLLRAGVVAAARGCINARVGPAVRSDGVQARSALRALRDAGMSPLASPLTAVQIDEIVAFLATACALQGAVRGPVTAASQGVTSAVYDLATIVACPHLLGVMNDPNLLQIAAGFLGCKPTISGVGLRWSFAGGDTADVQRFHRDTENWRVLRAFIYLTDVSGDSGPHQFVAQSHKTVGRLRLRPYSEQYIDRRYGRDKVMTVSGPRGTTFLADMWGIHRGMPPTRRPRLLFSVTYTMTATAIYDYLPVQVPDSHRYDRYTNRLLIC